MADHDRRFLETRRARRNMGLWALPTALAALVLIWGMFFVFMPLTVNPWAVLGRIEARTFEPGTLTMYAMMCTVLVNVVFLMLSAFLILTIAWSRHERRYQRMLGAASQQTSAQAVSNPT